VIIAFPFGIYTLTYCFYCERVWQY